MTKFFVEHPNQNRIRTTGLSADKEIILEVEVKIIQGAGKGKDEKKLTQTAARLLAEHLNK